jgi:hypothetical protein
MEALSFSFALLKKDVCLKLDEKKGANNFFKDRSAALGFWVVKRLVPFLLNKYFKFSEGKNGTQRISALQSSTKQHFRL